MINYIGFRGGTEHLSEGLLPADRDIWVFEQTLGTDQMKFEIVLTKIAVVDDGVGRP